MTDPQRFREGEEIALEELPENEADPTGNMAVVDVRDGESILGLVSDGYAYEFTWSKVECIDVKRITEDGDVIEVE